MDTAKEAPLVQSNKNWQTIGMWACLVVCLVGLAGCMFFNGGDIARSDVPRQVQEEFGLPATTSHNKSMAAYETWTEEVFAIDRVWSKNLAISAKEANDWNAFGEGLAQQAEGILLPWLGTAGLGGIGTLVFNFLRGQRREEIAYNQGRAEEKESLLAGQRNAIEMARIGPNA